MHTMKYTYIPKYKTRNIHTTQYIYIYICNMKYKYYEKHTLRKVYNMKYTKDILPVKPLRQKQTN